MTAFEELRAGTVGAATVTLLLGLIRQVGSTSSFPPPDGFPAWTPEAARSYLGALLLAKHGEGFVVQCAVKAHDQASLERLLLASIRHALIDEAKATPVGRLRRRLQGLLARDSRFIDARHLLGQDGWTLSGNGAAIWPEDFDELRRLTLNVRVEPIEALNRGGPTPSGPKTSLLTLSFEALRRASGAVRVQVLSRLLVERFELDVPPDSGVTAVSTDDPASTADPEVLQLARRYLLELSDEERKMLRNPIAVGSAADSDPAAAALQLRLRAWAGSDFGRDAVGVVLRWCSGESGRQS